MFNGKNSIALSGWKCDLLFIEKLKDLISKYEGKELAKQRMKVTPNDSTSIGKATTKVASQVAKKIGLSEKTFERGSMT